MPYSNGSTMLPDHCKDVSIREVDFSLTEENIAKHIVDKKAYTRTDHMVLRHGDRSAVIRVTKAPGKELFRPIIEHEILSMPEDTVYVEDESIDILNPAAMVALASEHPGKTVVVQGIFNHVSFVEAGMRPLRLRVLDTVPPYPSKMSVLVERAIASGYVDLPILQENEDIDLNDHEPEVTTPSVMFPCKASGLHSERKVYFLDETPKMEEDVTLIGCDLSQRIFRSVYRRDVDLINVCPWDLIPDDDVPTIVKCCKIKNGHRIDGTVAVVPWGATIPEVAEAIVALFESLGETSTTPSERPITLTQVP